MPSQRRCRAGRPRSPHTQRRRRRPLRLAVAAFALVAVCAGGAWAGGVVSPLSLFEANPSYDAADPGNALWNQHVLPSSVVDVADIDVPKAGPVSVWLARSKEGGWCGALRLPDGSWAAAPGSSVGGTVPGCYPTREQVNAHDPVYVIDGFDYVEDQVDARSHGGSFWRIEFGLVRIPDAVRVVDTVSGRSAPVVRDEFFALALPFPDGLTMPMRLIAVDADGNRVRLR